MIGPADVQPELDLWNAALSLLIEDGRGYVTRGARAGGQGLNAYLDLMRCGPMTCTLARFCNLDPDDVTEAFGRWVESNNGAGKREGLQRLPGSGGVGDRQLVERGTP